MRGRSFQVYLSAIALYENYGNYLQLSTNLAIRKCRTYPAPMGRNHRFAVVLGLIEEVAMAEIGRAHV